ncbi:AMP-binding protein, partial [Marinobacter sp.]|uniref:AMP-binding protein n=1 Tax=Marinobacter sp. TaxID=50741 RepID=UPI0035C6F0D3
MNEMSVHAPLIPGETFNAIGQQIQRHATERGNHPALITEQEQVSWADLLGRVNRIANRLRSTGLARGDTVAALSENSVDYVALYLGTLVAGGCMVPLSGMASAEALILMLEDSEARFLFVSPKHQPLLTDVRPGLQSLGADRILALADQDAGIGQPLAQWLGDVSAEPQPAEVSL